jgi:hypothetical protein
MDRPHAPFGGTVEKDRQALRPEKTGGDHAHLIWVAKLELFDT